jgi:hypothetical protein
MGFYSNTDVHFNHEGSQPIFELKDWNGHGIWDYFTFSMQQNEPHDLSNDFNVTGHKVTLFITEEQLREMRDKASEALRSRHPLTEDQEAYRVAGQAFLEDPSMENFVKLGHACDKLMPGATDKDYIRSFKQQVVRDCLEAIKGERLVDNTGLSDDFSYDAALDHAIQAVEALLPQQQGKTLLEVAAEEEAKDQIDCTEVWRVVGPDSAGKFRFLVGSRLASQEFDSYWEASKAAIEMGANPRYEYIHLACAPRPDAAVVEEAISYNSDPHPVTC